MIGQNVARASRSGLRAAVLLGRRTMVTQEERWTLETARNAGSYIEGPSKVELSHVVPNIEASWKTLSKEEQYGVFRQLEELQRKDWKELSVDQKKAGKYCTASLEETIRLRGGTTRSVAVQRERWRVVQVRLAWLVEQAGQQARMGTTPSVLCSTIAIASALFCHVARTTVNFRPELVHEACC